jgi:hypothetical protein
MGAVSHQVTYHPELIDIGGSGVTDHGIKRSRISVYVREDRDSHMPTIALGSLGLLDSALRVGDTSGRM